MTERVLVYVNRDLTIFGLANSLQKKTDWEFSSIVEMWKKPSEFFKTQDIIKFKKNWYFFEKVDVKKKPDLEYLKSIEEKYKINLWQIALTERSFLSYNKYHIFSHEEILLILENECKFFEKVLDESDPKYVLILMTDYQHLRVFHEICKARGIHVLLTRRTRFGFKWMITEQNKLQNFSKYLQKPKDNDRTLEELQNFLKNHDAYKQGKELVRKQAIPITRFFTSTGVKSFLDFIISDKDREQFYGLGRTKTKIIIKTILMIIKTKQREKFIHKNLLKKLPKNEKFVFFPLHDEPEGVVFLSAPYYTNQLEVIKNIAKSIPIDYKLYVKEHQIMQKRRWRPISYYKEIMNLPNVRIIHPSVANTELLENCSLVSTIAGTAGVEAAFYLKPSINFIDSGYSMLPSVYYLQSFDDLPQTIKKALETKVEISDLNKYVNLIDANSFRFNLIDVADESHPFEGSIVPNKKITEESMQYWLKNKTEIFDLWANEVIKKIELIKNKTNE
jgi:hypothetical protein